MTKRGRPKNTGYRTQVLIVHFLIIKKRLSRQELIEKMKIHRNQFSPNAEYLIDKGLIKKERIGHRMVYFIVNRSKGMEYLMDEFFRRAKVSIEDTESQNFTLFEGSFDEIKILNEDVDFVVDKELGIVTTASPVEGVTKIEYISGYEKTPELVRKATALITGKFLQWIDALIKKDSTEINDIPKTTMKEVASLLDSFTMKYQEMERNSIVNSVNSMASQKKYLESAEGIKEYKSYKMFEKWLKEIQAIDKEKRRRSHWKTMQHEGRKRSYEETNLENFNTED
jgi:hypothetical protein